MSCRNIPREAVDGFETLPEMYLGLGVRRDGATGVAQGADQDAPEQGIDLSALRDRDALECFNRLIGANPSLLKNTAAALQIIRHFQVSDKIDPNRITREELARDYGINADAVARQINAYLGLVAFLSGSAGAPTFPAASSQGTTPHVAPEVLNSYETVVQAYMGLGLDRDRTNGISQRPLPAMPENGLDLSVLKDTGAVARVEGMAAHSPALLRDLRRVRQIVDGFRQSDPSDPDVLTSDEVVNLYGGSSVQVLASINAYLGLVRRASPVKATPGAPDGQDSGVIPWALAGAVALAGGAYLVLRRRSAPLPPQAQQAIDRQIREMQNQAGKAQPAPQPQAANAIPTPPPLPPPDDVKPVIILPDRPEGRWVIGRFIAGDVVPLSLDPAEPGYAHVSARHAEISRDADGRVFLRDLGSLNGTIITRTDPASGALQHIVVKQNPVEVKAGDAIRLGGMSIRIDIGPVLAIQRLPLSADVINASRIEPLRIEVSESPLLDRLNDARARNAEVEIFMRKPNGTVKEKYAVRVVSVTGQGDSARVEVRFGNNASRTFRADEILTVRDRGAADDLSSRYIHPRLAEPQFKDKAVNISGVDGSGMGVLVDFADPRLTGFLEEYIAPVREGLERGTLSQSQAADKVRQIIHDWVPYDTPRVDGGGLPNRLYRLGDFIDKGVCNERGMLVQVSLQYVGIESRLEKGPFLEGRHAWVRAVIHEEEKPARKMILDPQETVSYEVGRDAGVDLLYQDDSTPFAQPKVGTVVLEGSIENAVALARFKAVPLYDADFHQALIDVDPSGRLAKAYRRISPEAHPARTVGELLDKAKNAHPHLAAEFENAFERTGSTPWKALFQIAGKCADEAERSKGFQRRHSGAVSPRERAALALDLERRMGGSEHERNSPRRPAERRDPVEREDRKGRRPGRGRP